MAMKKPEGEPRKNAKEWKTFRCRNCRNLKSMELAEWNKRIRNNSGKEPTCSRGCAKAALRFERMIRKEVEQHANGRRAA